MDPQLTILSEGLMQVANSHEILFNPDEVKFLTGQLMSKLRRSISFNMSSQSKQGKEENIHHTAKTKLP